MDRVSRFGESCPWFRINLAQAASGPKGAFVLKSAEPWGKPDEPTEISIFDDLLHAGS